MARAFRFRLEVVRKIRRRAQDAQRRVVADAIRAVTAVEERIARLTRELGDTMDRTRNAHQGRCLDVVSLRGHQFYRGHLHRRILDADVKLAHRRAELEQAREKLGEVTKEVKVIEKLREKQRMRHIEEVHRKERAAFDESALQAHLRRQRREEHCEVRMP